MSQKSVIYLKTISVPYFISRNFLLLQHLLISES